MVLSSEHAQGWWCPGHRIQSLAHGREEFHTHWKLTLLTRLQRNLSFVCGTRPTRTRCPLQVHFCAQDLQLCVVGVIV